MKVKELIEQLKKYEDYELFVEDWQEEWKSPTQLTCATVNKQGEFIVLQDGYWQGREVYEELFSVPSTLKIGNGHKLEKLR